MSINLANFEERARSATKHFWASRDNAVRRQKERGKSDAGFRAAVTAGKNMDGFFDLVKALVVANGLEPECIHTKKRLVTLPGFFRPAKEWDTIVLNKGYLVAALEYKSQVGPSFGNNFNNRVEEALGNATDLWTAFREGAFTAPQRPFVGYLMFLEDCKKSRTPVTANCQHFDILPEFANTSYAARYDLLCRKLVQEGLYSSACLLLSSRTGGPEGKYTELGTTTGLRNFVTALAGHIAAASEL